MTDFMGIIKALTKVVFFYENLGSLKLFTQNVLSYMFDRFNNRSKEFIVMRLTAEHKVLYQCLKE